MTNNRRRMGGLCLTWLCLNFVGCATLQFPWEKSVPHASSRNPVVQIVCLWEPSEGKDPEGKSCRGFAGQIIFLGNKGGTPVAVSGLVRVKEFDQFSGSADDAQPFHQFDFDKKSWDTHMHQGTLGPTYNVFIPYMRKGNHDAHCELLVEFTPADRGPPVMSTVTPLLLRGKYTAKETAAAKESASMIQHAPQLASDQSARTTTISLDGRGAVTERSARSSTEEEAMSARLSRMEQIMQDFAAQKAATPAAPVTSAAAPVPTGTRFSLNGRKTTADEVVQTAVANVVTDDTHGQTTARIPAQGRPRNYLSNHPLAFEDSPAETNPNVNVARHRHPLADEPAFAKNSVPQHRETPPATLVVPEELSDAPVWGSEENTPGHATLADELDGQTTQLP